MKHDLVTKWTVIDDRFDIQESHPLWPWFCPKPTIKILFYTDDPTVDLGYGNSFGVGRLRDLVVTHNTFHAAFQIDLVDRHAGGHANHKLTSGLLSKYDQVWVFGVRMCNVAGEPENELTPVEVADIRAWMDAGGGLLITGDHANPNPGSTVPLDPLLNLGRAIGHSIPRAGELRKWEGPPDSAASTHNTQMPDGVHNLDDLYLQGDATPQQLILKKYWTGLSWPSWIRRYRPHPLFCGRHGPIEVFPDHMHEGQLVIPGGFPSPTWPSGVSGQPTPEIVAWGTDKRNGAVYGITTAYDGAQANVGRIVADATWHHYFNINLAGFSYPSPTTDAIADYYVNLAVWLAPRNKRAEMRCRLWWDLAIDPSVRMVANNPVAVIGAAALDVLGRYTTTCLITDFVWPWPITFEERQTFPWPPEELVLGAVIREYQGAMQRVPTNRSDEFPHRRDLVRAGVMNAIEVHAAELADLAGRATDLRQVVERKFEAD